MGTGRTIAVLSVSMFRTPFSRLSPSPIGTVLIETVPVETVMSHCSKDSNPLNRQPSVRPSTCSNTSLGRRSCYEATVRVVGMLRGPGR